MIGKGAFPISGGKIGNPTSRRSRFQEGKIVNPKNKKMFHTIFLK
jgi:hypothetical protein